MVAQSAGRTWWHVQTQRAHHGYRFFGYPLLKASDLIKVPKNPREVVSIATHSYQLLLVSKYFDFLFLVRCINHSKHEGPFRGTNGTNNHIDP